MEELQVKKTQSEATKQKILSSAAARKASLMQRDIESLATESVLEKCSGDDQIVQALISISGNMLIFIH